MSDFVSDILIYKKGDLFNVLDSQMEFSPYMTQRYLSISSPLTCHILNETTNGKFKFLDKEQIYKLWIHIIPKSNRYTEYPKRKIKENLNELEKKAVEFLAQKHKISKREVEEYVTELNLNIGDIIKLFK